LYGEEIAAEFQSPQPFYGLYWPTADLLLPSRRRNDGLDKDVAKDDFFYTFEGNLV